MESLEIIAEVLYRGKPSSVRIPKVQPGMVLKFRLPGDIMEKQQKVGRVLYNNNNKNAQWDYFYSDGNMFNAALVSSEGWSDQMPEIMANETYTLTIVEKPSTSARLKAAVTRNPVSDKKAQIQAQVLTQSSLTPGSLVYLTDSNCSNVYAVSADKLMQARYGSLLK